jgi:SAM-dependent methyltransferase
MQCRSCGLIYANPMPFPRDHSHYDEAPGYFGEVDTDAKIRAFATLLARVTQRRGCAGRMIDIGCGRGESLVAAQESGWDAVGVEPSARFAEAGRRELRVDIDHGHIDERTYAPHSFDLVLLSGVLEHVYAPMHLLELARGLLADGGILYVDVPTKQAWLCEPLVWPTGYVGAPGQ